MVNINNLMLQRHIVIPSRTISMSFQVVLNLGKLQSSHEGRISCLGLSDDGSALCTGSWDKNLKVNIPILFLVYCLQMHFHLQPSECTW